MRVLASGEEVVVVGNDLIAGDETAGKAVVKSLNGQHDVTTIDGTTYGISLSEGEIVTPSWSIVLRPMMYFSVVGECAIRSKCGIAVTRCGYIGLNSFGGPVECKGRLKYIDGCTDTLLISPPLKGDPCFNLLHFPPNTDQTMHTHPSLRCGITIKGEGVAAFPEGEVALKPGSCWFLMTGGQHRFYTKDDELLVTAWHPDSDCGPTHEDHPMLNRTYVEGVSAKFLDDIRTR